MASPMQTSKCIRLGKEVANCRNDASESWELVRRRRRRRVPNSVNREDVKVGEGQIVCERYGLKRREGIPI
jgi:hypothetical protein